MAKIKTDSFKTRGSEYGVSHYIIEEPVTLPEFFHSLEIPAERAKELLWLGAVYINEKRFGFDETNYEQFQLETNDKIRVHLEPRRFFNGSLKNRITEIHPDYYIVDKPGGLPSHPLVDNIRENLLTLLADELNEKLFVTHRLDVVTKGLLIVARTEKAQSRINELIKNQAVKRTYKAVTESPLAIGTYVHFMEESPRAPKILSKTEKPNWQRCELEILACDDNRDGSYHLSIRLVTGRSQQIRAQLAFEGAPIVGDTLYGSKLELADQLTSSKCIKLTATAISLEA